MPSASQRAKGSPDHGRPFSLPPEGSRPGIAAPAAMRLRRLLGGLAALPALTALPGVGTAQAQDAPLPSWNDGAAKRRSRTLCTRHDEGGADLRSGARGAARHLRQGRHALGREPDLRPGRVRARPGPGPGAPASGMGDEEPFKTVLSSDRAAIAKLAMRDLEASSSRPMPAGRSRRSPRAVRVGSPRPSDPRCHRPYTSSSTSRCWS